MLDAVIFEGNEEVSEVEKVLIKIRHATLADNMEKLLSLREINRVFLVTNQPVLADISKNPRFFVELNNTSPAKFHFGNELLGLIERRGIKSLIYLGGASVPLIRDRELAMACRTGLANKECFVTNNIQSADMLVLNRTGLLYDYQLPATDNALGLLLRYDARLNPVLLPATLGTQYDIDTPTDIMILAASPFGGGKLRTALDQCSLDLDSVKGLKEVLKGDYKEIAVIGRVGAPAISRMNCHLKIRLRIFSEERGMKALGRLEREEVVSLLGYWLEEIGPARFFAYFADTVQAVMMDTRVIFAHMRKFLSTADRFYSDLGLYNKINDPWIREFTYAAVNCGIPVILGGHSLVSGGIWALTEELARPI